MIRKGGHSWGHSATGTYAGEVRYSTVANPVTDGSSNTIMFMEKAVNQQFYSFTGEAWWDFSVFDGADWSSMRTFSLADNRWGDWLNYDLGLRGDSEARPAVILESNGMTRELGFGSAHPGSTMAVLGDGSTQTVRNTADITLLHRLARTADGGIAGVDDL